MSSKANKLIVVTLILALMVSFPPKRSDAIIAILFNAISLVTVILDLIVMCAFFCQGDAGQSCERENICGETASGVIQGDNTCSAQVPIPSVVTCTSAPNDCEDTRDQGYTCISNCNGITVDPVPDLGLTTCTSNPNSCGVTATENQRLCGGAACNVAPPPVPAPTTCNSAANFCGTTNPQTATCGDTCVAPAPPSDYTGSCSLGANYCGMTDPGQLRCDGQCIGSSIPSDTLCTNFPLDVDDLAVDPPVVRLNTGYTINYDIGQNFPSNCSITGPNLDGFTFEIAYTDGDIVNGVGSIPFSEATGPHQYTITCGAAEITNSVRILPTLQEG
ncbi:MAG: hypothetical protein ACI92I_000870 [Acidimicrobiales bacterium]|jgi:hypothetical protein